MNGGVTIPNKDTARALNDLARHKAIVRILNDIRMDMEICEIEGFDKNEYLNQIRQLLNSTGGAKQRTETHACDLINRQAIINSFRYDDDGTAWDMDDIVYRLEQFPSAQSERTCVNCGRTANNGGWYADGRTRCPIEEHYALPKDGYCHLWEKRNVADDDYPERREE